MPLLLKSVPPSRGPRWIADAWALFRRKPLAFVALFCVFFVVAILVTRVPLLGVLALMATPLLSLGFMVAAQAALLGDTPHPKHLIEPLRGDPARRKRLLLLCAGYGVAALAIIWICNAAAGDVLDRMEALLARGAEGRDELRALMADPRVSNATLLGFGLSTLLSIPYWHAAALVHWGGQGAAQALFSSTLALWRNKGAFALFGLAWSGLLVGFSLVGAFVLVLLVLAGLGMVAGFGFFLLGVAFTAVFYVAQLFTFNDCFGGAGLAEADDVQTLKPPA